MLLCVVMCHTQYIKSTDKLTICERCDCWCCIKCLKMYSNDHKVLNSRSDCHWFCPECEEQALTDAKIGMDIEAKYRQYIPIIEDRVRSVENQLLNIDHIIKLTLRQRRLRLVGHALRMTSPSPLAILLRFLQPGLRRRRGQA